MSTKGSADTEQEKAVTIVEGEYPAQYGKNKEDLQTLKTSLVPFPEEISEA